MRFRRSSALQSRAGARPRGRSKATIRSPESDRFNDQALAVAIANRVAGSSVFAGTVGAHLRHVIEHYDALLFPVVAGEVHYDRRKRDRALGSGLARLGTDRPASRGRALAHQIAASIGSNAHSNGRPACWRFPQLLSE